MTQPAWDGQMGRQWATLREATDRQLHHAGQAVLDLLSARPGERVIDLGCGGATTTLAIADAVGPTGHVTGIDISPDLAAHARARTADRPTVAIINADAAAYRIEAAHDALFSRHGCMFFDDPAAAFANLRAGLRPGGRLALSCFAALEDNPRTTVPMAAAARVLGPLPAPQPGAPGPFGWADPALPRAALTAAGFGSLGFEQRDVTFTIGAGDDPDPVARACNAILSIGPVARRIMELGGDAAERVRPELAAALRDHVRDGWVRLAARICLIQGRA